MATSVEAFFQMFRSLGHDAVEAARCGEGFASTLPTALWALGTAVLAQWLVKVLFRRFLFRRIPLWELIVQELVFTWLVVYGVRLWFLYIQLVKYVSQHYEHNASYGGGGSMSESVDSVGLLDSLSEIESEEDSSGSLYVAQQALIWLVGLVPLATALHIYTRPQPPSPIMIWIAASPWQRREMGPYGYYLNRPPSIPPTTASSTIRHDVHRLCYSDTDVAKSVAANARKRHSQSC